MATLTVALGPIHSNPHAEILPTHTAALFETAVKRAAELLRAGEVVALPTETVYGLAANALNAQAVEQVFEIKGRPARNPVIVHVTSLEMARQCASRWPRAADELARAFWPGPLTFVLPRAKQIPDIVTAGGPTVGIRWPSHPFIQAVIRECGFPLAAPSANLSNQISPTNAAHVNQSLGGKIPLIVDGGQSQVGIESTVLDLSTEPHRILRRGMIHAESLQAALADEGLRIVDDGPETTDGPLRSPGMLRRHYAPKAKLNILSWQNDQDLQHQIANLHSDPRHIHVIAHTVIPSLPGLAQISVIPHDAEAFARAIYAELHRCDDAGAQCIIVEAPPDAPEWRAIADRLQRAAA